MPALLVECVHQPCLLFANLSPNERLGWLVYEIQHLPIYIHLQPCLLNEGGLHMSVTYPVNFFLNKYKPRSNVSCAASGQGLTVMYFLCWCQEWNLEINRWPIKQSPAVPDNIHQTILRIWWYHWRTNGEILKTTKQDDMGKVMEKRWWDYLGHVVRRRESPMALSLGKTIPGRPNETGGQWKLETDGRFVVLAATCHKALSNISQNKS